MSAANKFEYDVFISYADADKAWVRNELLPRLEKAGLKVCFFPRDMRPGAARLNEWERAVTTSERTVLILTDAYLQGAWDEFGNLIAQTLDPAARDRRVIPVLKDKCKLPLRIAHLTPADFTDPDEMNNAWIQLITALGKPSLQGPHPVPSNEPEVSPSTVPPTPIEPIEPKDEPPAVKNKSIETRDLIVGGLIGFGMGVLGSLLASWLWQDVFKNTSSLSSLLFVLLMTAAGVLGRVWLKQRNKSIGVLAFVLAVAAIVTLIVAAMATSTPPPISNNPHAPIIQKAFASPSTVHVGQSATLTTVATDPDNDNLVFYWKAQKGNVPAGAQGDIVTYTAPNASGIDTIEVTVGDGQSSVSQTIRVSVLSQ